MIIEKNRDNFYMLNWLDEFMVGHNGFICGGCFKNIFNHEKVKDLDIFFKNESDFEDACEWFDNLCEDGDYFFYYENDNVKAYKHKKTGVVLELICKVFGTPKEIISNFDFTITKFAYFKKEVKDDDEKDTHIEYWIALDNNFFEHLHLNRLVTDNKILYPMSTFERMIRYIGYGYKPCKETKMKITQAIHSLSPREIEVSESLYDGVD